ncbi:MAG: nucleotide exchange factor GrpE [Planctomycetota bacterium]
MSDTKPGQDEARDDDANVDATTESGSRFELQLQRALADMANLRKRMHKEIEEARRKSLEGLTAELLPVLDNFHLALGARSEQEAATGAINADAIVDGLRMVKSMLEGVLERHGLSEIRSDGCEFDPNVHEAVGVDSGSGAPPGRIVQVMARGYRLGERVLRPSRVIVAGSTDAASTPRNGESG